MSKNGKNCYVYVIVNNTNGRKYVGQTTRTPMIRFFEHSNPRKRGHKSRLTRAILKEGKQNFSVQILEVCEKKDLDDREKHWIRLLGTWETRRGYNRTMGGQDKAIEPIRRRRRRRRRRIKKK